jgi:hypothetical protein
MEKLVSHQIRPSRQGHAYGGEVMTDEHKNLTVDVEGLAKAIVKDIKNEYEENGIEYKPDYYDGWQHYLEQVVIQGHLRPCPECERLREELETIKGLTGQDAPDTPTARSTVSPDKTDYTKPYDLNDYLPTPDELEKLLDDECLNCAKIKAENDKVKKVAESLCKIYFDIAAKFTSEENIRALRDEEIARQAIGEKDE